MENLGLIGVFSCPFLINVLSGSRGNCMNSARVFLFTDYGVCRGSCGKEAKNYLIYLVLNKMHIGND